jgi:hypothetical protein
MRDGITHVRPPVRSFAQFAATIFTSAGAALATLGLAKKAIETEPFPVDRYR